jgi:protein-disulfide isomerase
VGLAGASLLVSAGLFERGPLAARVEARVRRFMLKRPEVLLEAVQREEAKQAEKPLIKIALREEQNELFNSQSPVSGNLNGDVTIVEFFDYNCFYCRKARPVLDEAITADKGLRLVHKEWPILGPNSDYAARAALAAQVQGKYEAFHQALMKSSDQLDENATLELAQKLGLNIQRLKMDMESETVKSELQRNLTLAKKLRLGGTPAFIIGEEVIGGFAELPALQEAVRSARQKAGK